MNRPGFTIGFLGGAATAIASICLTQHAWAGAGSFALAALAFSIYDIWETRS